MNWQPAAYLILGLGTAAAAASVLVSTTDMPLLACLGFGGMLAACTVIGWVAYVVGD